MTGFIRAVETEWTKRPVVNRMIANAVRTNCCTAWGVPGGLDPCGVIHAREDSSGIRGNVHSGGSWKKSSYKP